LFFQNHGTRVAAKLHFLAFQVKRIDLCCSTDLLEEDEISCGLKIILYIEKVELGNRLETLKCKIYRIRPHLMDSNASEKLTDIGQHFHSVKAGLL